MSMEPTQRQVSGDKWLLRHPWLITFIWAIVVAAGVVSITRLRPSATLDQLISSHAPAAQALGRVLTEFSNIDELTVLVSLPDNTSPVSSQNIRNDIDQKLLPYANRLRHAIEDDPVAKSMVTSFIASENDEQDTSAYIKEVMAPAAYQYLDQEEREALKELLTPSAMKRQFDRLARLAAAPGPGAEQLLAESVNDPLQLRTLVFDSATPKKSPFQNFPGLNAQISADGRHLIIHMTGAKPSNDLSFAANFTSKIRSLANEANIDNLTIGLTGGYAIAAASQDAVRSDLIISIFCSVLFVQLLFLLVYRHLLIFLVAIIPVAAAIVIAFGAYGLIAPNLTPLTAVIGALITGLGVDYCIHFLSSYDRFRAASKTPQYAAALAGAAVRRPIFVAATSSIIGILAISQASVTALRQFALIGGLGLIAALIAALTLLPALLVLIEKLPLRWSGQIDDHIGFQHIARPIEKHPRAWVFVIGIVWCLGLALWISNSNSLISFESDLRSMHPSPNPTLELQDEILTHFGTAPGVLLIEVEASNETTLLQRVHAISNRLDTPTVRAAGIQDVLSVASLLPPQNTDSSTASLPSFDPDQIITDFKYQVEQSLFTQNTFSGYTDYLRTLLTPSEAPTLTDLKRFPALANRFLPTAQTAGQDRSLMIVLVDRILEQRSARDHVITTIQDTLSDIPEATLTGISVLGYESELLVRRDLLVLIFIAAIAVGIFLLFMFRRFDDLLLLLIPVGFGLTFVLLAMSITGTGFNLINLLAIPLLIGIGVDDGIFIMSIDRVRRARKPHEAAETYAASCHAITMTTFTTALAIGALALTSVPAIAALGWMTAVGVFGCLVATIGLLLPILLLREARQRS